MPIKKSTLQEQPKVKPSKENSLNKVVDPLCCSLSSTPPASQFESNTIKSSTPAPSKNQDAEEKKSSFKTRLTIKYDIGFQNKFFIRGKGANLSWDKGQLLVNTKPDEWVWEIDTPFNQCEFKVLINDEIYELGENHFLNCGSSIVYTPHF